MAKELLLDLAYSRLFAHSLSLPAGIAEMNLLNLAIYTFIGSFLWSGVLAYLGLKLGQNWQMIEPIFQKIPIYNSWLFVLSVVYYIYSHLKRNEELIFPYFEQGPPLFLEFSHF